METDLIDILVVDDMRDAAESLATLLEIDGYNVRLAFSAQEALEAIAVSTPLCVLLDISMPEMDGLDLTRHLRAKFGDDVILVAITGHSALEPRVVETFALVDHYFVKPILAADIRKLFPPKGG
ncbi:response regulator [Variovorax sp. HJSM1_2]|uniref:response regulator n=1 Tax=Variovorax sp. HJSM1_2 TaxID=3366263 RepID=UPI003BC2070C